MSMQLPSEIAVSTLVKKQKISAFVTSLVIILVLSVYHEVTWSIISTWIRSDTYAHGFLILPFSVYMIWKQRNNLSLLKYQPSFGWLLVLGMLGFGWLLATLASVLVVEQYALIAMIPATVCIIMGYRFAWAIAFPLAYLFFAVPFGEALIPPLIDFTADFTVTALQMTGIPVYREGSFFSLSSGNWSVVEACSGLRYLIASVTLGTLYAYLTYRSLVKRILFIVLSIVVPIVANGMRAYLIVMTGHLSNMQLAVGVDHLVYGWVFFGLVMMLLFWIGSYWREGELENKTKNENQVINPQTDNISLNSMWLAASLVVVIILIWPAYANYLNTTAENNLIPEVEIIDPLGKWEVSQDLSFDWVPRYIGEPRKFLYHFKHADQSVNVHITYYRKQNQGAELINSRNVLVSDKYSGWRSIGNTKRHISLDSDTLTVNQSQLQSYTTNLLVWRWYWLGNEQTANPYFAKAILAMNKFLGYDDDGAEIIVTTSYNDHDLEAAAVVLQDFLDDMLPVIARGLQTARPPNEG